LEELHDCCVDLTNRLNAAEARETDLASELTRREEEVHHIPPPPFPSQRSGSVSQMLLLSGFSSKKVWIHECNEVTH